MPTYTVHAAHPDTGEAETIRVAAFSAADAESRVQRLGLLTSGAAESAVMPNEDATAFYVAIAGLLVFPLSVVGWVWGKSLYRKSGGAIGRKAWHTGRAVFWCWMCCVVAPMCIALAMWGAVIFNAIDPRIDLAEAYELGIAQRVGDVFVVDTAAEDLLTTREWAKLIVDAHRAEYGANERGEMILRTTDGEYSRYCRDGSTIVWLD